MNMSGLAPNEQTQGYCSKCGAQLLLGAFNGLCPKCMARLVFGIGPPAEASPGQTASATQSPDTGLEDAGPLTPLTEKPGDAIGPYKLLERIGEGGCGIVYLAQQEQPLRRQVALKIVKLGMDTRHVIARFEAERQVLALMEHPNIAKVLDAGATATGRPYFVMELVKGTRITEYCDQHNLSTEARLDLFIQVCHAIQHAHQKGIIHRDIKPSNILVTLVEDVPTPKVIDFGIAKATGDQVLTDKTLFTAFEQFIGTPAYMSPEQAELSGQDVDTRSDIYALGVLLYELLTGQTPFDAKHLIKAGLDEVRRVIREQEPLRPSTRLRGLGAEEQTTVARRRQTEAPKLIHQIHGDLDWIVMKCLEKDRQRRYETANGLAMDVERHLNHEPIVAGAPAAAYRAGKFVRRHRTGLAALSTILLLLVGGAAVSTWEAVRARVAERRALTEASKSRHVAQFLERVLSGVDSSVAKGRDTTLLKEILAKTADQVEQELRAEPEVQAEVWATLGQAYWAVGDYAKSEAVHRKALTTRRRLYGNEHPQVAASLDGLIQTLWSETKFAEAQAAAQEEVNILQALNHTNLPTALNNLGLVLQEQGKLQESEPVTRQALELNRRLHGLENRETLTSLNNLALLLQQQGKLDEAEKLFRDALPVQRKLSGSDDLDVVMLLNNLGVTLLAAQKLVEAEGTNRAAIFIERTLLGEHPYLASSLNNLARVLCQQDKLPEAEERCKEGLAMRRKLLGDKDPDVAISLEDLALIQKRAGRLSEAQGVLQECVAIRQEKMPQHWLTFRALNLLGQTQLEQKNYGEAEPRLLASYAGLEKRQTESPSTIMPMLKETCAGLARLFEATSQTNRAAEWRLRLASLEKAEANESPAKNPVP